MSPQIRTKVLLSGALLALLSYSSDCEAQVRRYQPATPTISPYLNLVRNDNLSGLPNYYSLVRPQLYQQNFNQREQALRRQQAGQLGRIEQQLQRETAITPTGKQSQFFAAGTTSTFLNSTHYYQPIVLGRNR